MSNYKTLSQLTQEVITELSMYRGTGTQKYAEDRIADKIIRTFIDIYDQRYWNHLTDWYKFTLAGENGVVGEDVSKYIKNFNDIECITTENNPKYSLKRLHDTTNPFLIKGNTPAYYKSTTIDKKIFQIIPFNATGVIYVRAKTRPVEFNPDTIIPFDSNLLVYKVCWDYCCDDGNSSLQVEKYKQLYENRYNSLLTIENNMDINYNDEEAFYPLDDWR